jgi:hypothetical protein
MNTTAAKNCIGNSIDGDAICKHLAMLGHKDFGASELRIFEPRPMVAYVDNEDSAIRLCQQVEGKTSGIFIGVQPRQALLYDLAPNCWHLAQSAPHSNCARDSDIEYITAVFFDVDVVSEERRGGYPASEEELKHTLYAAQLLSKQDGLALNCVICCSGNGHYVLAPIVPIPVYSKEEAVKIKYFCEQLARKVLGEVVGVKIDPVYNLSRVMRLMGTWNRKGQPTVGRAHRRAYFVTEPIPANSMALHHMILNTEVEQQITSKATISTVIHCDLNKLENCEFIRWSRSHAVELSEPLWWALITNLAHLEGGIGLIHEISRLDPVRYDYADTQHKIQKAIDAGYRPVLCKTIVSEAMTCAGRGKFQCSRILKCRAKAPMYMTVSHTVYTR